MKLLRKLLKRQGFAPTVIVADKVKSYGMQGFKSPASAQRFVAIHAAVPDPPRYASQLPCAGSSGLRQRDRCGVTPAVRKKSSPQICFGRRELTCQSTYNANHSILWAIIHGIFGWFYVVYAALARL